MMKRSIIAMLGLSLSLLGGCALFSKEEPVAEKPEQPHCGTKTLVGGVEPVYFPPMKSPFFARIDTGAKGSALDAKNAKTFERDGEAFVSFALVNRETGEKHVFEKPIAKHITVKRAGRDEKRAAVKMEVKIGDNLYVENFSLAQREKFTYEALIGRNILNGRMVVDPAESYTLR